MTDTAYDRLIDDLRNNGQSVNQASGYAMAQCPAHSDNSPSLRITPVSDRVIIKCHAGCETADVVAALGRSMADLFDNRKGADYRYCDGRIVHRTAGKKFRQSGNTKGTALFHVEKLGAATTVHVVEGEQDVLAIEAAGGAAVCSAMGAGKAHLFDWTPLAGKHVVVVADRDEPGFKHARAIEKLLHNIAANITIVVAAEGKDAADHIAAGHGLDDFLRLPEPPPAEDGAALLAAVQEFAGAYLAFPTEHHITVLTLWAAHTWATYAFYVTPRLVLDSPEPGCAKTRVLEVLSLLTRKGKVTVSTSPAALFRRIDADGMEPPTVLQDEADAVFGKSSNPQTEDLRAIYNSGYKRGATVDRCEGDSKNMTVREFPVFAPVAMAGLAGKIPKTIIDRGVVFHMRHRAPDEHVAEYRGRDAEPAGRALAARLDTWVEAKFDDLAAARPAMPEGVTDRPAEVWEALLAVADAAGGDWPQRARAACVYFVLDSREEQKSLGIRLLTDLRNLFGDAESMASFDIIAALTKDEESDWCDLWGTPLDQRRLAKELKRYNVYPKTVRSGVATPRGYRVDGDDGLGQAWRAYLGQSSPGGKRNSRNSQNIAGQSVSDKNGERNIRNTSATPKTCPDQDVSENVALVAAVAPKNGNQATAAESAAYINGLCRDCKQVPHSPGRPRCQSCYKAWQITQRGYES
jgi:5S rRNA maturation endonuclease (ribonuclease M5)